MHTSSPPATLTTGDLQAVVKPPVVASLFAFPPRWREDFAGPGAIRNTIQSRENTLIVLVTCTNLGADGQTVLMRLGRLSPSKRELKSIEHRLPPRGTS